MNLTRTVIIITATVKIYKKNLPALKANFAQKKTIELQ